MVSMFIRGAKPNFTMVLIDGVKVNDDTNTRGGSFDFSTLSLRSHRPNRNHPWPRVGNLWVSRGRGCH